MSLAVEQLLEPPSVRRPGRVPLATLLVLLRLGEALLVALLGCLAWSLNGDGAPAASLPWVPALAALLTLNLAGLAGLYRPGVLKQPLPAALPLAACLAVALLGVTLLDRLVDGRLMTPGLFALWLLMAAAALLLVRAGVAALLAGLERKGLMAQRVVVVGAGEQGQRLVRHLRAQGSGVRLIGLFDDRRTRVPHYIGGFPVLGGINELLAFAVVHPIDMVVLALPLDAENRILDCLGRLRQLSADVRLCSDLIGFHLGQQGVADLAGVPLLKLHERPLGGWSAALKAVEDQVIAALVLLLVAPLLLLTALAVRLTSKGPALFRQKRLGRDGRVIEVLKLRTMYEAGEGETGFRQATRTDPRVTPLGRLLRRVSLDELPQFINVLRGEMSVVGPRPYALAHNEAMAPLLDTYPARYRVKPGITGWAQVNGLRGETDTIEKMQRRLEHDLYYVENWSLGLDLRILLRTLLGGFIHPNAY